MANEKETVEQVCEKLRLFRDCDGDYVREIEDLADDIEVAHKRELAAKDDARLTVVANYEAVIAAKERIIAANDAEIARLKACRDGECERIKLGAEPCEGCHWQKSADAYDKLRALVKELADALDNACNDLAEYTMVDDGIDALIAKAREVCK